ncbi:hypothetical protein GJ496_004162 [Pomphorhynchus laevis]|nr:hypothetical protein GJ496_004162 [Pomphorhynchus laevis]
MSINDAYHEGGVLLFSGERIIIYYDGIKADFSKSSNPILNESSIKGRIYLTTHRTILLQDKNRHSTLQSFALPFQFIVSIAVEQPVFGANYLQVKAKSANEGNFEGVVNFNITFKRGGAIEFSRAIARAVEMANLAQSTFGPPDYQNVINNTQAFNIHNPNESVFFSDANSWVYHETFSQRPPANEVYMKDELPPYTGIVNPNNDKRTTKNQNRSNESCEKPPPSYEEATDKKHK